MNRILYKGSFIFFFIIFIIFTLPTIVQGEENKKLVLYPTTKGESLYPSLYILSDNEKTLTIEDVTSDRFVDLFNHSEHFKQNGGFFEMAKWIRIEIENRSDQKDWLLEFAFPLIYYINIYEKYESRIQ